MLIMPVKNHWDTIRLLVDAVAKARLDHNVAALTFEMATIRRVLVAAGEANYLTVNLPLVKRHLAGKDKPGR